MVTLVVISSARINWILVLSLHRPVSCKLASYKFFVNGIIVKFTKVMEHKT